MKQIYDYGYFPSTEQSCSWARSEFCPAFARPQKAKAPSAATSTDRSGLSPWHRRLELVLWKLLTPGRPADLIKFGIYTVALIAVGLCATLGLLPRTRPIVPGEIFVGD
jgi:hypothetical protein